MGAFGRNRHNTLWAALRGPDMQFWDEILKHSLLFRDSRLWPLMSLFINLNDLLKEAPKFHGL
jgi:hypothetical protein